MAAVSCGQGTLDSVTRITYEARIIQKCVMHCGRSGRGPFRAGRGFVVPPSGPRLRVRAISECRRVSILCPGFSRLPRGTSVGTGYNTKTICNAIGCCIRPVVPGERARGSWAQQVEGARTNGGTSGGVRAACRACCRRSFDLALGDAHSAHCRAARHCRAADSKKRRWARRVRDQATEEPCRGHVCSPRSAVPSRSPPSRPRRSPRRRGRNPIPSAPCASWCRPRRAARSTSPRGWWRRGSPRSGASRW